MIEFIIGVLVFIVDVFYGGFVFQYGWNHFIHVIGFPTINYVSALGIGMFIDMCKYTTDLYKVSKGRERKNMSEIFVDKFGYITITLIIMIVINLFM